MVDYIEQQKVAQAMIKWGGGFISTLGLVVMRADRVNAQKIKDAFSEYWEEYLEMSKKLEM